jgi:Pyruvate/2-oxoacid:ferredoxin oxidoreductase delta subunit
VKPTETPPRSFYAEWKASAGLSLFDLLHGYVYLRWPYFYIANALGEHPLSRLMTAAYAVVSRGGNGAKTPDPSAGSRSGTMADGYHGKVVPLDGARKLVTLNQPLTVRNLEQVIPYPTARDIVLQHPDHIAVLQCPCRTARKTPCRPLDVCLIVGEPFAGFVLQHHPRRSRRIEAAEAVEILEAEDQRGHAHHAFFKDATLGRFYAICNCCRCCCGAMQAHRHGIPMLASSGYVAEVNAERCIACGTCAKYCPFEAVQCGDGRKVIDEARCLGCGVCVSKCARGAIRLRRDAQRGAPLEIDQLAVAGPAGG